MHAQICLDPSELLLGVAPHSGCLVWVGEVGFLPFLP